MDAPPVQYVKTRDGYSIAYTDAGKGRPFVHLPTTFNHARLFWSSASRRAFFEPLLKRFRLIQFDERGSGMSQRGLREDHSLDDLLLDLEAVAEELQLRDSLLFAMQPRVRVAIRYALKHPSRVAGLVLWNPWLDTSLYDVWLHVVENWEHFVETTARTALQTEDITFAKELIRQSDTPADFVRRWHAFQVAPSEESLSELRVPTLILSWTAGAHSFATEDESRRVAAAIPHARLLLFDDLFGGLFDPVGGEEQAGIQAILDFEASLPAFERSSPHQPPADVCALSIRELEVLRLLAAGRSNAQIADELVISLNTVRRHVSNIFDKEGAANRTEAAALARDHGIL